MTETQIFLFEGRPEVPAKISELLSIPFFGSKGSWTGEIMDVVQISLSFHKDVRSARVNLGSVDPGAVWKLTAETDKSHPMYANYVASVDKIDLKLFRDSFPDLKILLDVS